jgi:tRNA threonylcarbamoyladenosine biosynthesis protein TsaB
MIVLAADTSTAVNTVSVTRDDRLLAETVVNCGRKHSERLLETVDWVVEEADLALGDVELLAVSVGPGSFTGLRIGVATWKGLALGVGRPLLGVPTLDGMTRLGLFHDALVCPLLDAKMHEVFGALYEFRGGERTKIMDDRVGPPEAILREMSGAVVFFGDGATLYEKMIRDTLPEAVVAPAIHSAPRASAVAAEAVERLHHGAPTDPGLVNPVYLRKSQPEELREKAARS